ncbi:uncharacterized protein HHUB_6122 (plasmid) [Halobacterium hubeiense]|jgi:hypothetical protein|uniref:Uncharacterized protein n=1 Tax=Halobacterium hubeiense TaxID=1407499 RepID=A0A0U5D3A2_9EURY|nr:hypothetical protein [Halobacterium hubeiense]CQH65447.1 uncharacterized protein HHUB_6122 [Halobacterium hubeiense]
MAETSIGVSEEVKARLEPVKEKWGSPSWNAFMDDLVEQNVDIDPEELDEVAVEKHERIEKTRATAVGVLEALDEADMVNEAVEIIKEMSQQRMLAEHQRIIDHFLEKSRNGEPPNEMDELLARVIIKTEGVRDQETPAAEIARGLFNESTTAERTTTQEVSSSTTDQTAAGESVMETDEESCDDSLFDGIEDADGDI